ncbi:hypothetical protein P280DRAFT_521781 [Massarina eburnea CBS 473.64]|uniref:Uncharacterized protein n=1 Tax=Massarina eburnea CBS 473.64 TaxID=1395130 RepID=A0A6A6RQJ4_9PLEO|nr:hypothetical protein P280DRAFT_521781 [Massarina eburnea CBS 473.64]
MSPAPITQMAQGAPSPASTASAVPTPVPTPPQEKPMHSPPAHTPPQNMNFDDRFHLKFMNIIDGFKKAVENDPHQGPLTQKDRKTFIDKAYSETDEEYFGGRRLSDQEIKLRALTRVFYKVLAEEPWSEEWIRPSDVERKLSRFEMHKDSVELAAKHGITSVREGIKAARVAETKAKELPKGKSNLRGPYDDIEVIFIPGTVSSTATAKIDRSLTYPVSVASVAHILSTHICRDMTRPFAMAQKFVTCTDTEDLTKLRQFACDVCDYAPHLLDNDNCSLLIILLILTRSDICKRFTNNGIRIEGSTISHRKAECMKGKLGWKTADERKPFDNVAAELQTRVKNACFPPLRAHKQVPRKSFNANQARKTAMPSPAMHPNGQIMMQQNGPRMGYFAPPGPSPNMRRNSGPGGHLNGGMRRNSQPTSSVPSIRYDGVNTGINIPAPPRHSFGGMPTKPLPQMSDAKPEQPATPTNGPGASLDDPMDID